MFDFDKKDLERLYQAQIKNDIEEFPISSRYLHIADGKMIFISKYKNDYRLYCSGNCDLESYILRRTAIFDILYINKDLNRVINAFHNFIYIMEHKI